MGRNTIITNHRMIGNNAQQFPLIQNANDDYCIFFGALKSYAQLLVFYTWWELR